MSSPQHEVSRAILAKVAPGGVMDAELTTLGLLAIYNFRGVPPNAPYPYLTIGDAYEIEDDTLDPVGYEVISQLHLYSHERSTAKVSGLAARLRKLLHREDLTLTTLQFVSMEHERTFYLPDRDNAEITHAVAKFRTATQEST